MPSSQTRQNPNPQILKSEVQSQNRNPKDKIRAEFEAPFRWICVESELANLESGDGALGRAIGVCESVNPTKREMGIGNVGEGDGNFGNVGAGDAVLGLKEQAKESGNNVLGGNRDGIARGRRA